MVLASLPASSTPRTMTITGRNTLQLNDVLIGEVWLCSGQSNMEFRPSKVKNADAEIASANFPLIRAFNVRYSLSNTSETKLNRYWTMVTPSADSAANLTAVGYYFARIAAKTRRARRHHR